MRERADEDFLTSINTRHGKTGESKTKARRMGLHLQKVRSGVADIFVVGAADIFVVGVADIFVVVFVVVFCHLPGGFPWGLIICYFHYL